LKRKNFQNMAGKNLAEKATSYELVMQISQSPFLHRRNRRNLGLQQVNHDPLLDMEPIFRLVEDD